MPRLRARHSFFTSNSPRRTAMAFIQLDYDTWFEQFKPITKPGTDHIAFDTHDDIDFLRTQPNSKIWTLIDCPGYNTAVIVNGYWRINRLEYYVTEVAHDEADEYNIE
jgi:hypothetical protein